MMKKTALALTLLGSFHLYADDYLIQEMENLKASLSYDDPARKELTLRLADLYFETSIKEGTDLDNTRKRKSLELYRTALNGTDGISAISGQLRNKVRFQEARLLYKLGKKSKASKIFEEIFSSKAPKDLKRESAFSLAEYYEENAKFEKANKYYVESINLCSTIDTCNYAHYKRGWLLYKETKLDEAISELRLSLWDSKGQVRDKVLKDLILFLSNRTTDGLSELKEMEQLESKTGQSDLIRTLAESFYTAGNNEAGSNLLAHIDRKVPNSYYKIRLLEHHYGFRNWNKFNLYLSGLEKREASDLPKAKEAAKECLNIMRRMIVQLDAETVNNPEANEYLLRNIDLYLSYYPQDEMRKKMISGWLKAQKNNKAKIDRLATWIEEEISFNTDIEEIRKLRQNRLAMAQKEKLSDIVIDEAMALAKTYGEDAKAREFEYVAAREMYGQKKYDEALPIFKKLAATAATTGKADKWAVLSQNLALDIYNANKDFKNIIAQVDSWKNNNDLAADKTAKKELAQMDMVSKQAKFEWAASKGETKEALEVFYNYCMNNIFAEKACTNAKVLSVKLKDQAKLVSLLEKANDEKALMAEYELMGRFADAAKLQEKLVLKKKPAIEDYLKVATLYELDFDFKNRDKILKRMIKQIKRNKKMDEKIEKIVFMTLDEAGLINNSSLTIPWSLTRKLNLAHRLEIESSNKKTQKIILSQNTSVGPVWGKLILQKVQKHNAKQAKVKFYGRRSKRLFKRRTNLIQKLNTEASKYLEGARSETRVYLLDMLAKAYGNLSQEIMNTPIPEGLDAETLQMVQTNLTQMAAPFVQVSEDYKRLLNDEMTQITELEEKERISNNLTVESPDYASFIVLKNKDKMLTASIDSQGPRELLKRLKDEPENTEVLQDLEAYYKMNKSERLASYYTGRIKTLNK
jgi:hypothetical protein